MIVVTPPLCQDSGPIWLRCGFTGDHDDSTPHNIWVRIDLFRLSSHTQYDSTLYEESCILIDEANTTYNYSPESHRSAVLLHRRKEGETSNPHQTSPPRANTETFYVTYDCPAKVTLFLEPKPTEESSYGKDQKNFENQPDLVHTPPWQLDMREVSRIKTPQVTLVQDDCLQEEYCHLDLFSRTRKTQYFVADPTSVIRFPKS